MFKALLAFALLLAPLSVNAATDLLLWHAMRGAAAETLVSLAERFNESQQAYHVVPQYRGAYDATLAAGLEAARQGKAPHLLQVYEVGTADMMAERGLYKPVYQLAAETRLPLDKETFLPPAAALYSDPPGRLLAQPFNTSTPVLYYSRDAFIKAGLDPDKPPKTWYEMQPMLIALQAAGIDCPYTTSWQSWVHVENVSALHNYPIASGNNGFGAGRPELQFNTHLMVRHISLMSAWMKSALFIYSGRTEEGDLRFATGECAMFTGSSAVFGSIAGKTPFRIGVAPLPHYDDFEGAPFNTLVGGGALWVMGGKTAAEYAGVARFLQFLESPESVIAWHKNTGYVPITRGAYVALQKSGYYEAQPEMQIAVDTLRGARPANYARGIRLRHYEKIRDVIDDELEQVWKGLKPPKQALDDAVVRGNLLLGAPAAKPCCQGGPQMRPGKPAPHKPAAKRG